MPGIGAEAESISSGMMAEAGSGAVIVVGGGRTYLRRQNRFQPVRLGGIR